MAQTLPASACARWSSILCLPSRGRAPQKQRRVTCAPPLSYRCTLRPHPCHACWPRQPEAQSHNASGALSCWLSMQYRCCMLQCAKDFSQHLQAKLVKSAVTGALLAMKESCPFTLLSGFEQRMGCLADIARSAPSSLSPTTSSLQGTVCMICRPGTVSLCKSIAILSVRMHQADLSDIQAQ